MMDQFSADDVVITVTRLTHSQLARFIEGAFVKPERGESGYVFHHIDIARLELLCDLTIDLDMDETAIGIIISLIDQLHAARQDCATMAKVIDALPDDIRDSVVASLKSY